MAKAKGETPAKLSTMENFALSLAGGGTAAIISKTIAAPIERVKLLLQCQSEMLKQGTLDRPYSGAIDCTRRIFRNEFLHSFWRGNLANCIRYFPTQAMNFFLKDEIKMMFKQNRNDSYMVSFTKNIASGTLAGALSLTVVYSLDYARTRLANDLKSTQNGVGERKYNSLLDVYRKTLVTDGIVGLYRGFISSCVGIAIYRGCYFGLYDTLKPIVLRPDSGVMPSFLLGYGVTVTAGLISYPIDTIRRRMMMRSGEVAKYKGALDCMSQIIEKEGALALFKGAGVNIVRGIAGAISLVGFDKFVILYTGVKVDTSGGG